MNAMNSGVFEQLPDWEQGTGVQVQGQWESSSHFLRAL
jgi:hypothetical protein